MPYSVPKKPNLIRNSIPLQIKQAANSLSIHDWNTVINILRNQTNLNTQYLEMLHRVLFYDFGTNTTGSYEFTYSLNVIMEKIPTIESDLQQQGIDIAALNQALSDMYTTLNTSLENIHKVYFGNTIPDPNMTHEGDLWYDTTSGATFDNPQDQIIHDDSGVGTTLPEEPTAGDEWIIIEN